MKVVITRLSALVGRHWLRIGLLGCGLILLSQKQVDFRVQLGHPDGVTTPANDPLPPVAEGEEPPLLLSGGEQPALARAGGFFSRFNVFGGGERADRAAALERGGAAAVRTYLERFAHVAQAEQQKFGVPASVHLAAGLLFSQAGQQAAANNYFALPCTEDWSGTTDRIAGRCQRSYPTAWASHRDFSTYVTTGRFAAMRQFGPQDYRRWARGLAELGLNGEQELAEQLIEVIEGYGLGRYD